MLSPALLHTWEKEPLSICKATASSKLFFVTTPAAAFTAELLCGAHGLLAGAPCCLPLPALPAPREVVSSLLPGPQSIVLRALRPYSTEQNMVLTQRPEPKTELSHVWASDSGHGTVLHPRVPGLVQP